MARGTRVGAPDSLPYCWLSLSSGFDMISLRSSPDYGGRDSGRKKDFPVSNQVLPPVTFDLIGKIKTLEE